MLQKIRDRIGGWAAAVLFGFLALVFAVWGIQYDFSPSSYAAKVNGEEIPLQQIQQAYRTQLNQVQQYYGTDLPEPLLAQLRENVLESEIREVLLRRRGEELGYRIGDDAVRESIRQIPQFQVDGQFSEQTYRGFLAGRGLTPRGFEEDQRVRLRHLQLQNAIAGTAFTTDIELARYTALEDEQREVAWVRIPAERFLAPDAVEESAITDYYEAHREEFRTSESVSLQYVELRRDDLVSEIEVSEQQLRQYYEEVASRYTVEEERKASHILIAIEDGDEDKARAEADDIKARLDAGGDFADLARQYSDDAGSAATGGELDWAGPGVFVGPFEEALFSMKPGEIRGPIQTRFGFHIIRLDAVREGSTRSFEELRPELEAEYREREADELFRDRAEQLAEESFASFNELEPVAEQLGLPLREIDSFTRLGGGELGADPKVIDAIFSPEVLEERQNSPLVEVGDGRVAVFRVTDHRLPEQKLLGGEVTEEIRQRLADLAAQQAAREVGEQMLTELRSGSSLDTVAGSRELEPTEPQFVQRTDAALPASLLSSVFGSPEPEGSPVYAGLSLPDGDYAVYGLSAVTPGDWQSLDPEQQGSRRQQLAAEDGRGQLTAYVEELRLTADVIKPEGVFEEIEY